MEHSKIFELKLEAQQLLSTIGMFEFFHDEYEGDNEKINEALIKTIKHIEESMERLENLKNKLTEEIK